MRGVLLALFAVAAANSAPGQGPPAELAIGMGRVQVDGDLTEWAGAARIAIDKRTQLIDPKATWDGPADCSAELMARFDSTHFYLAGRIEDDHEVGDVSADRSDRIE